MSRGKSDCAIDSAANGQTQKRHRYCILYHYGTIVLERKTNRTPIKEKASIQRPLSPTPPKPECISEL